MTIYLTLGQRLRLLRGSTDMERRYFVAPSGGVFGFDANGDRVVDTSDLFAAPSTRQYDMDGYQYSDDGISWTPLAYQDWLEVTDIVYDTRTQWHEGSDDYFTDWSLDVSGFNYDESLIARHRAFLVVERLWADDESGNWSPWHALCVGYIRKRKVKDNADGGKEWDIKVESFRQYFETEEMPAQVLSYTDLALNQAVTTSDTLVDPLLEAGKGEYLGLPVIEGQNLTDGDDTIPWISDIEPNLAPVPFVDRVQDGGGLRINEVYLAPPTGYGTGYQFIEIVNTHPTDSFGLDDVALRFFDNAGTQQGGGPFILKYVFAGEWGVNPETPTQLGPRSFMVICENRRRLEQLFTIPADVIVAEWKIGPSFRNMTLDTTKGYISLHHFYDHSNADLTFGEVDRVMWGTGDEGVINNSAGYTVWYGNRVAVPGAGKSFRRVVVGGGAHTNDQGFAGQDGNSAADWISEDVPTPGRALGGGTLDVTNAAYASVALPTLGIVLDTDLVNDDTTVNLNTTGGLYTSGHVQIVATQAQYTAKTATTLTLASAWAGGTVPAGTPVYAVEGGVSYDLWPVKQVQWRRKQKPTPAVFSIYTSTVASPLYPGETDWQEDWALQHHTTIQTTNYLTADVGDGDTTLTVDRTTGWPVPGTVIVAWSDANGSKRQSVRITAKTATTVTLEAPWTFGDVDAGDGASVEVQGLVGASPTWDKVFANAVRARHAMVVCYAMSDLGRFKLNGLSAYPDQIATSDPDVTIDGTYVDSFIKHLVVDLFGVDAAKFSTPFNDANGFPEGYVRAPEINSQRAPLLNILRDGLSKTGLHARFTRGDGFRLRPVPEHPMGTVSGTDEEIDFSFGPGHAVSISLDYDGLPPVSQAVLKYQLTASRVTSTAYYPAEQSGRGTIYQHDQTLIVPDDRTALWLAIMYYQKRADPLRIILDLKAPVHDWLHPLAVVLVRWPHQVNGADLYARCKVTSIDEWISGDEQPQTFQTRIVSEFIGVVPEGI